MDSERLYRELQSLADGQCSPDEAARLRRLIERDARAAEVYRGIAGLKGLVRDAAASPAAPEALHRKVLDDLRSRGVWRVLSGGRGAGLGWAAAAAVLIALGAGYALGLFERGSRHAHAAMLPGCVESFREAETACGPGTARPATTGAIRSEIEETCGLVFEEVPRIPDALFCGAEEYVCPSSEEVRGVRLDYVCRLPESGRTRSVCVFAFKVRDMGFEDAVLEEAGETGHVCLCTHYEGPLTIYCRLQDDTLIHVISTLGEDALRERFWPYLCPRP